MLAYMTIFVNLFETKIWRFTRCGFGRRNSTQLVIKGKQMFCTLIECERSVAISGTIVGQLMELITMRTCLTCTYSIVRQCDLRCTAVL